MLALAILMVLAIVAVLLWDGSPVVVKVSKIGGVFVVLWFFLLLVKFLLGQATPIL